MNRRSIAPLALAVTLSMVGLAGCQGTSTPQVPVNPTSSSSSSGTSGAGGSTGSGDVLPIDANPIVNTSTAAGLTIVSAAAEDNVDSATKAPIGDRLQITLRNDTSTKMTGLEIFYTMTDATTGKSESYYQDLGALTIPANSETTIAFDGQPDPGHYPENKYSLYRSSQNKVDFTIEVSAANFQPAQGTATKGAGTGETTD